MKVFSSILALLFVVTLASCGGGSGSDIKKVAKKACECGELAMSGDMEKAQACGEEMESIAEEMEEKYGDISDEEEEKMEADMKAAMMKSCPDLAGKMGG